MPKAGNLKSTFIVTSDDLKVNGGRWLLQSGPAIRVRGFNSSNIGDRRVIGGDALPIYILQESDARVNGGQFLLKGGQPIQVTDVIGSARGIIQGKAIPVWPVDDDGNYDPTFASYSGRVIATGPIAYWILGEAAGAIAVDQINSPAQDGAYTGVTLGQPGIGDGNTAPFFDGINDFVNIFSAAFAAVFNGPEGTLFAWIKVFNAGVWADATGRRIANIQADAGNLVFINKEAAVNTLRWRYRAGGVSETIDVAGFTSVDWFPVAITWSKSAGASGEVRAYSEGLQVGATQVLLGVWAGAPGATTTVIGAFDTTPLVLFHGYLAHVIVWDRALPQTEILNVSSI